MTLWLISLFIPFLKFDETPYHKEIVSFSPSPSTRYRTFQFYGKIHDLEEELEMKKNSQSRFPYFKEFLQFLKFYSPQDKKKGFLNRKSSFSQNFLKSFESKLAFLAQDMLLL